MAEAVIAFPRAPVSDVFGAVATELTHAQTSCGQLDSALGRLLELVSPEARAAVMQELYVVDLLNQHIAALAGFLSGMEEVTHDAALTVAEAMGRVSLGAVAERLQSSLGAGEAAGAEAANDLELF